MRPAKELYADKKKDENLNPYEDETAELLREGNYEALLNKQVQAYNLKNNAQKYYQNELANKGVLNSGYGTSAQLGIQNDAIKLYQQNQKDYYNTEKEITEDAKNRYDAKQTELDNQLASFIQNDINNTGGQNVDTFLTNYGYKDKNGNYTDKWTNLDENRKAYLESMIASKAPADNSLNGNELKFDFSDLSTNTPYYDKDGNINNGTIDKNFRVETKTLYNNVALGNIPNGSHVKLVNGKGSYLYVYYKDGNFYYQTESQYKASNNKYEIKYASNDKASVTKGA